MRSHRTLVATMVTILALGLLAAFALASKPDTTPAGGPNGTAAQVTVHQPEPVRYVTGDGRDRERVRGSDDGPVRVVIAGGADD